MPALPDPQRALEWARAERANLLACLDFATRSGQDARVIALTAAIAALLRHDGPWIDALYHHTAALRAARASVTAARQDLPAALADCEEAILSAPVPERGGRVSPRAVRTHDAPYPARTAAIPQHVTYTVTIHTPPTTTTNHHEQPRHSQKQPPGTP